MNNIMEHEVRGKLVDETTIKMSNGEMHKLQFTADSNMLNEDVVVRGTNITRRIDS